MKLKNKSLEKEKCTLDSEEEKERLLKLWAEMADFQKNKNTLKVKREKTVQNKNIKKLMPGNKDFIGQSKYLLDCNSCNSRTAKTIGVLSGENEKNVNAKNSDIPLFTTCDKDANATKDENAASSICFKRSFNNEKHSSDTTQLHLDYFRSNLSAKTLNRFRYGNFPRYYGYRNQHSEDSRLICMKKEWFEGLEVLDIGCNTGHFTLSIAKHFLPKTIIGIDIDDSLVASAMKNVRHYLTQEAIADSDFPTSLVLCYGPCAKAVIPSEEVEDTTFPYNVSFVQGNYVLESSDLLALQEPQFDTILCLSLTKWIHLNWGDEGLKLVFHRMHAQLKPGGHMILEAQPWSSYSKKKKITEETYKYYQSIQLFPEHFNEYLMKEVKFSSCELIDTPFNSSKGFCRPIYLLTK